MIIKNSWKNLLFVLFDEIRIPPECHNIPAICEEVYCTQYWMWVLRFEKTLNFQLLSKYKHWMWSKEVHLSMKINRLISTWNELNFQYGIQAISNYFIYFSTSVARHRLIWCRDSTSAGIIHNVYSQYILCTWQSKCLPMILT